tara:strand:- start:80453 stop:80668 length:216 start_codon:yes stop_codon:yes gene_type:complete
MRIDDLIEALANERRLYGNLEVTVQATLLPDGYSQTKSGIMQDVFESTVETMMVREDGDVFGKRLRLLWQT